MFPQLLTAATIEKMSNFQIMFQFINKPHSKSTVNAEEVESNLSSDHYMESSFKRIFKKHKHKDIPYFTVYKSRLWVPNTGSLIDFDLYIGDIFKDSKCVRIFDSDDEEEECFGFSNWESLKRNGSFGSH